VHDTQMYLALKKGAKHLHYISNPCGIFSDFCFS
jgi:hypothetical protein